MRRRRPQRRSPAEYFLAAVGLALLILVVAIAATGSCRVAISPEIGVQPSSPTPTHESR